MAKKYLKGSDVESDPNKEKARLLGIAHELYVQRVEDKGTDYLQGVYGTMYGSKLVQKKVDSGLLEEDGSKKWTYSEEYALELDTESDDYTKLVSVHKAKEKDAIDLENEGWDLT